MDSNHWVIFGIHSEHFPHLFFCYSQLHILYLCLSLRDSMPMLQIYEYYLSSCTCWIVIKVLVKHHIISSTAFVVFVLKLPISCSLIRSYHEQIEGDVNFQSMLQFFEYSDLECYLISMYSVQLLSNFVSNWTNGSNNFYMICYPMFLTPVGL